jgi:transcription initiation factor IIE alpha subunit
VIICNRCETEVTFDEVSEGYFAFCPKHDEDLYKIETRQQ